MNKETNIPVQNKKSKGAPSDVTFGGQALMKRYQKWLRVEIAGLCVLIIIVWGLLTLPIVFYYQPLPVNDRITSEDATGSGEFQNDLLACRENFHRESTFNNTCVPTCPNWRQDPKEISITVDVVVFLSYFTGFAVSISILVISVLRHKSMFSFPNILVVYMTLIYTIQNFFYIVTFLNRSGLYCSSENLLATFLAVTPFCIISGMVQVYSTLSVGLWWFILTVALFWKVWFPFHAKSYEVKHKNKYIHITCAILGLLIPLVPIIALMCSFAVQLESAESPGTDFVSGGMGFSTVRFPPLPCNGNNKSVVFYTIILPTNILLASGITLTILIFWLVHKQHGLFRAKQCKNPFLIGTSERKLLIIFCYYIISTVINLTAFSDFARKSDIFQYELNKYFVCEQLGHNPASPCDRKAFEQIISRALVVLSYGFHGTLPIVNLIFAINIQELKSKCQHCKKRVVTLASEYKSTATSQ